VRLRREPLGNDDSRGKEQLAAMTMNKEASMFRKTRNTEEKA